MIKNIFVTLVAILALGATSAFAACGGPGQSACTPTNVNPAISLFSGSQAGTTGLTTGGGITSNASAWNTANAGITGSKTPCSATVTTNASTIGEAYASPATSTPTSSTSSFGRYRGEASVFVAINPFFRTISGRGFGICSYQSS
jgi:hypothetical protein